MKFLQHVPYSRISIARRFEIRTPKHWSHFQIWNEMRGKSITIVCVYLCCVFVICNVLLTGISSTHPRDIKPVKLEIDLFFNFCVCRFNLVVYTYIFSLFIYFISMYSNIFDGMLWWPLNEILFVYIHLPPEERKNNNNNNKNKK